MSTVMLSMLSRLSRKRCSPMSGGASYITANTVADSITGNTQRELHKTITMGRIKGKRITSTVSIMSQAVRPLHKAAFTINKEKPL